MVEHAATMSDPRGPFSKRHTAAITHSEEASERPPPTVVSGGLDPPSIMTAALVHLTGPGMRSRCRGFGARLLAVLAVVLPVPVFAVLGLSLPLPATVERIAAGLVPFGDAGSPAVGTDGTIVLVPGEHQSQSNPAEPGRSPGSMTRSTGLPAAVTGPRAAGPSAEASAGATAPAGGDVRGTTPTDDGRLTSAPSSSTPTTPTSETTTPPEGGSEPAEPPTLVDTATSAANGAVNTATTALTDTVGPPADTAKGVVDSAEGAATGALGPIKP